MPRLTAEQARLVEQHSELPLIATRSFFKEKGMNDRPIRGVEKEEVHAAANEELCKIAAQWDPSRAGRNFQAYALRRLKWAIIDFLREHGPKNRDGSARPDLLPLMIEGDDGELFERTAPVQPGFEGLVVGWDFFVHVLSKVGEREREVLWMRYVEGLTLGETGEVLGVSESRVSQIEAKAMRKLRRDADVAA